MGLPASPLVPILHDAVRLAPYRRQRRGRRSTRSWRPRIDATRWRRDERRQMQQTQMSEVFPVAGRAFAMPSCQPHLLPLRSLLWLRLGLQKWLEQELEHTSCGTDCQRMNTIRRTHVELNINRRFKRDQQTVRLGSAGEPCEHIETRGESPPAVPASRSTRRSRRTSGRERCACIKVRAAEFNRV